MALINKTMLQQKIKDNLFLNLTLTSFCTINFIRWNGKKNVKLENQNQTENLTYARNSSVLNIGDDDEKTNKIFIRNDCVVVYLSKYSILGVLNKQPNKQPEHFILSRIREKNGSIGDNERCKKWNIIIIIQFSWK